MQTHLVMNQSSELFAYDLYKSDSILFDLIARYEASWANELLSRFGRYAGAQETQIAARQAENFPPILQNFDRFGNRIDRVDFHPAYHGLMSKAIEFEIHSMPWNEERSGAHLARAALMFMDFQLEPGHCCPVSMTFSVLPSLRKQPDLATVWEKQIRSNVYDNRFIPFQQKNGLTMGMAMTEKQGGSDVRANTTRAVAASLAGPGKEYKLTGHKWFCSAPMSDGFLMLAQAEKGLSCFLVPRLREDGKSNGILVQRLKDKLGNKANASSEIELEDASGFLIGEEGRGVPIIIEMVNHTRLDCVIGSAALMRQSLLQAWHHCRYRSAFGKLLINQPLMLNVLADLALESEAATRLMMRLAFAYDQEKESGLQKSFKRITAAVAKYWICKRSPAYLAEALECLGGNGYVESGPMPRLFRESPLLSIWEGSGNVICLDVLRAAYKEPETLDSFLAELEISRGISPRFDKNLNLLKERIQKLKQTYAGKDEVAIESLELEARTLVEHMALCLQAALMLRQSPEWLAEAFIASRLERSSSLAFGSLALPRKQLEEILERSFNF